MLSLPADPSTRTPRRVPLWYRTDDPRFGVSAHPAQNRKPTPLAYLVHQESGDSASLDALNRALSDDLSIMLCRPGCTCDCIMRCILCSQYRMAERRADLKAALRGAPAAVMVTLTFRHGYAPLSEELSSYDAILARFTKRGDWRRFQKRNGITGYAVSTEITHNATGWNVHLHLVLSIGAELTSADAQRLQDAVTTRWCNAAAWTGHDAVEGRQTYSWMRPGFDAADMAEYVTKQNLLHRASESARGRYPADLLAGAGAGDDDDLDLYREYLDAVKGRAPIRAHGRLSPYRVLDFDELLRAGAD